MNLKTLPPPAAALPTGRGCGIGLAQVLLPPSTPQAGISPADASPFTVPELWMLDTPVPAAEPGHALFQVGGKFAGAATLVHKLALENERLTSTPVDRPVAGTPGPKTYLR